MTPGPSTDVFTITDEPRLLDAEGAGFVVQG